jgi:hypothetical protein
VTADRESRAKGDAMEVAATLSKPLDLDELLTVLERYCR